MIEQYFKQEFEALPIYIRGALHFLTNETVETNIKEYTLILCDCDNQASLKTANTKKGKAYFVSCDSCGCSAANAKSESLAASLWNEKHMKLCSCEQPFKIFKEKFFTEIELFINDEKYTHDQSVAKLIHILANLNVYQRVNHLHSNTLFAKQLSEDEMLYVSLISRHVRMAQKWVGMHLINKGIDLTGQHFQARLNGVVITLKKDRLKYMERISKTLPTDFFTCYLAYLKD